MSQIKNRKIILAIIFLILSFFAFGCGKKTPVENVTFNIGENQIVMFKGQSLDISNFISVLPIDADDRSFSLSSSNSSVASVVGARITANAQGSAIIRVVSNSDSLKEDVMTVRVENEQTKLNAPDNLLYDSQLQSFVFDKVDNASKYILKINEKEYDIGNSLSFDIEEVLFDKTLSASVKAVSAKFNYAYTDSDFSNEIKIYQISSPQNVEVVGGEFKFKKEQNLEYNFYENGEKIVSKTTENSFDLTNLDASLASSTVKFEVEAVADDVLKSSLESDVKIYNSKKPESNVYVLDAIQPNIVNSTLSWSNLVGVDYYEVYIDNQLAVFNIDSQETTKLKTNSVDLKTWTQFENFNSIMQLKVVPTLLSDAKNVALSSKLNILNFSRLSSPTNLKVDGRLIEWDEVGNASVYNVEIDFGNKKITSATTNTYYDFDKFDAGEYSISIWADSVGEVDNAYLLFSKTSEKFEFEKCPEISNLRIENKVLKFDSVIGGKYLVEIDSVSEMIDGVGNETEVDLSSFNFASGNHTISVKQLSNDDNSIDGNAKVQNFFQLNSVEDCKIANGSLQIVNSATNKIASICNLKLEISDDNGLKFNKTIDETYLFNTDDDLTSDVKDEFLTSGAYTGKLYILGDESSVFSYPGFETFEFEVLAVPTVSLIDKSNSELNFVSENASSFELKQDGELINNSSSFTVEISSGETKEFVVNAIGNGSYYLNSKPYKFSVKKLTTPSITFDDVLGSGSVTLTEGVENENGFDKFEFDSSDWECQTLFGQLRVADASNLTDTNTFSLVSLAKDKDEENDVYFLNSNVFELNVSKISTDNNVEMLKLTDEYVETPNNISKKGYELHISKLSSVPVFLKLAITVGSKKYEYIETAANKTLLLLNGENYSNCLKFSKVEKQNQIDFYVDLLNYDFSSGLGFISNSTVTIEYSFLKYGDKTVSLLDSETVSKNLFIQKTTNFIRDDQSIKFNDVLKTKNVTDYAVLCDGEILIKLSSNIEQFGVEYDENTSCFVFDMQKVFAYMNKQSADLSYGINSLQVVSLNNLSNADNLVLSFVGSSISVIQARNTRLNLNPTDNDDSSFVLSFAMGEYKFNLKYVLSFYNKENGEKVNLIYKEYILNEITQNKTININLDQDEDVKLLSGEIYFSVVAITETTYDGAQTFNSFESDEYCLLKLPEVENVFVQDGYLKFTAVEGVKSYAIYKQTASNLEYVASITDLSNLKFDLKGFDGITDGVKLGVKAISDKTVDVQNHGKINSNLTSFVTVQKLGDFVVSIENGNIKVQFATGFSSLLNDQDVALTFIVEGVKTSIINLKSLGNYGSISGSTLTLNPNEILSYNQNGTLIAENLSFELKLSYNEDSNEDKFYINPSVKDNYEVYPMFSANTIAKSTSEDTNGFETVETISWLNSDLNRIDNELISSKYIVKITYTKDDNVYTFYTGDSKLKYKNNDVVYPYDSLLSTRSITFPVGYDTNGDGDLLDVDDIVFGAGEYGVQVQIVPDSTYTNVARSLFSEPFVFTIMESPKMFVLNGVLNWNSIMGATNYIVEINGTQFYQIDGLSFDLKDVASGINSIRIKAVSFFNNYLNSEYSNSIYTYKLENYDNSSVNYSVEDGNLILRVPKYFTQAKLIFIDSANAEQVLTYNIGEQELEAELSVYSNSWGDYVSNVPTGYKIIKLNSNDILLDLISGKDYTIKIQFIGNSANYEDDKLGVISSDVLKIDNLKVHKLKDDVNFVENGVIEFGIDSAYGSNPKINYNFMNQSDISTFWTNAILYRIHIEANQNYDLYAIDYNYFENNKMQLDSSLIKEYSNLNQLRYKVKFVDENGNNLYFGVYKDNKINIKDYDYIYYFNIQESYTSTDFGNSLSYTANSIYSNSLDVDYSVIDLTLNDFYIVSISVLGGDDYLLTKDGVDFNYGYLTSNRSTDLRTFIRYQQNTISTNLGKIQISDLRHKSDGKNYDDYPIYRLDITPNGDESQVVYLYYSEQTTLQEAKEIASLENNDFELAIFVPIEYSSTGTILFDLSKYFTYHSSYMLTVRALAGKGNQSLGIDSNYLVNAKSTNLISYTAYQPSNTQFTKTNTGYLSLNKTFINLDGTNIYYSAYEIELTILGEIYTYSINSQSEGVSSSGNAYIYSIPSKVVAKNSLGNEVELSIEGGTQYSIRVRGIVEDNMVNARTLNGVLSNSYNFSKSNGVIDLKFVDGKLIWKTNEDASTYRTTTLVISYESMGEQHQISLTTYGTDFDMDSEYYGYKYYDFPDGQVYDEVSGVYTYIQSGIEYTLRGFVTAKSEANKLNSTLSEAVDFVRLDKIYSSSIVAQDGVLTWAEIDNADKYYVQFVNATDEFNFESSSNELDLSVSLDDSLNKLASGVYSVYIRAVRHGENGNFVNSLNSERINGFIMLDYVDSSTIQIDGLSVSWSAVDGAEKYKVKVVYGYTTQADDNSSVEEIETYTNSIDLPQGINGKFKISVQAISTDNKTFNSQVVEYESSRQVPAGAYDLDFNMNKNFYYWYVNLADFSDGDSLYIEYEEKSYVLEEREDGFYSVLNENWDTKTLIINADNKDEYFYSDPNLGASYQYYHFDLREVGLYRNFKVRVDRSGTASSAFVVLTDQFSYTPFASGAGTSENPYTILNKTQLLNVSSKATKGYSFIVKNNIDLALDQTSLASCYDTENDGRFKGIIAEEFVGTIDFDNKILSGFNNVSLNDRSEFALFKSLTNATIKNLQINSIILSNTFASNNSNVVKLSVITIGATNSNFDNVTISSINLAITANTTLTLSGLSLAGIAVESNGCGFNNVKVVMQTTIGSNVKLVTSTTNIAGISSITSNSTFTKCSVESINENGTLLNFVQDLRINKNAVITNVAGLVANASYSTFSGCIANIYFDQVKATNLAHIVARCDNSNVNGCSSNGTISYTNLENRACYIGGIVGRGTSTKINSNKTTVKFNNITTSYTSQLIRFGAVVGSLENITSELTYNTVDGYTYLEETKMISGDSGSVVINIGEYGNLTNGINYIKKN